MAEKSSKNKNGKKARSKFSDVAIRLIKEKPLGTVGAVITLFMLFVGIFAGWLAPHGMNEMFTSYVMVPPSAQFPFGTDNLGRDIFSRVIYGARISVIVGLTATFISVVISTTIGVMCGYIGGKFDLIVQRFVDAFMCVPGLVLLMVIVSMVGPGMWQIIIILGIQGGIGGSRMMRGIVFGIKENTYLQAALAIGDSTWIILTRHILPNILAPIIIIFSMNVPGTILAESGLSFLGFGIPPPNPSWGGMLSGDARTYMFQAPWMALWPGLALSVMVYGVNMFGDAVRDLLDPRLRGGVGRYGVKVKRKDAANSQTSNS